MRRAAPVASSESALEAPRPPAPPPPEARDGVGRLAVQRARRALGTVVNEDGDAREAVHASTMASGARVVDDGGAGRGGRDGTIDLSAEMYDGSPPYAEVLHIPNGKVGLVIGREGRHVGFVQNRTGTRISIARDSWDGAKRRVEIEGPPERCREAVAMIHRLIDTSDDRAHDGTEGAIGALFEGLDVADAARAAVATAADVAARADLALDEETQYNERNAEFVGGGGALRAMAPSSTVARLGPATATMTIPHTKVGMIIGRGGDNVKYIQQRTRARIQIQTDAETPEGAPARTVFLRGPVECCRHAARMINDMCVGRVPIQAAPGVIAPSPLTPTGPESERGRSVDRASRERGGYHHGAYVPPAHAMEYQPMPGTFYPPFFSQPYTGLYNPPSAYAPQDPSSMMQNPYAWNPYAAQMYYGAPPPLMPAYALNVGTPRDDGTTYYEQPQTPPRDAGDESGDQKNVSASQPSAAPETPPAAMDVQEQSRDDDAIVSDDATQSPDGNDDVSR